MTARQRQVLEHIRPERPLCYGGENHFFFHGGQPFNIHGNTGFALLHKKWVKLRRRRADQPFWLSEYDLTAAGKKALSE